MSVSVMHLLYSLRRLDGGMGGLWKISGLLETGFSQVHVWGQSGVRTSRRVGEAARNKFVAFIRPHLVDSGVPE